MILMKLLECIINIFYLFVIYTIIGLVFVTVVM
jgi:hypothetical protein